MPPVARSGVPAGNPSCCHRDEIVELFDWVLGCMSITYSRWHVGGRLGQGWVRVRVRVRVRGSTATDRTLQILQVEAPQNIGARSRGSGVVLYVTYGHTLRVSMNESPTFTSQTKRKYISSFGNELPHATQPRGFALNAQSAAYCYSSVTDG